MVNLLAGAHWITFLSSLLATPERPSQPPPSIAARIHDGVFDPGDYQWLRGRFDGATPSEIAAYRAVLDWRRDCRRRGLARTRAELQALGVDAGPALDSMPYKDPICGQVATLPEPLDAHDWNGFARDVAGVRPIALSVLSVLKLADEAAPIDSADVRDALNARSSGDQAIRAALAWAQRTPDAAAPALTLTAQQRGILASQIAIAMAARDHANTTWLKRMLETRGWPERTRVGAQAAKSAWQLAQHADADPSLQVTALRLMEPLVLRGEVERQDYAFLYDRTMMKLTGRQRYGTQLTCVGSRLAPRPLEDERQVDALRRDLGMEPLAAYSARASRETQPC